MKAWWHENREEILAGIFLVALLVLCIGVLLTGADDQARKQVRICQKR